MCTERKLPNLRVFEACGCWWCDNCALELNVSSLHFGAVVVRCLFLLLAEYWVWRIDNVNWVCCQDLYYTVFRIPYMCHVCLLFVRIVSHSLPTQIIFDNSIFERRRSRPFAEVILLLSYSFPVCKSTFYTIVFVREWNVRYGTLWMLKKYTRKSLLLFQSFALAQLDMNLAFFGMHNTIVINCENHYFSYKIKCAHQCRGVHLKRLALKRTHTELVR